MLLFEVIWMGPLLKLNPLDPKLIIQVSLTANNLTADFLVTRFALTASNWQCVFIVFILLSLIKIVSYYSTFFYNNLGQIIIL